MQDHILSTATNHLPGIMTFTPRSKIAFVIILLSALFLSPAAQAKKIIHHKHHKHVGAGVSPNASYADIIIDAQSGEILHSTEPDQLRHPASLTKMMTLYLTFQALEAGRLGINQYLPVSANAAEQSPSKLGLRPGQRIRAEDAILGLVTESANDAAVVLAEWLGGSEEGFAALMTRQAHALGMNKTHFNNPSGLPNDGQVTTARDMAVLGHALIYHFPEFYPYFSHDHFVYAGINHHNHNHLMSRYDGMDGIKTGYIRASGFNLVASAKRGSTRLIGVVFGGHSTLERDNRMALLLDQAFTQEESDKSSTRASNAPVNSAEGDADDNAGDDGYVGLPAKVAAIFPQQTRGTRAPTSATIDDSESSKTWGIQIGAYTDADVGQQALSALQHNLPQLADAVPMVQKVAYNNTTVYRARLTAIDQKAAEEACAHVARQGQPCQVVSP